MTSLEFITKLSDSYSSRIPDAQASLIRRMVDKELPEHGIRHFLDYVMESSERRPNASTIRGLLNSYRRDDPTDADEHGSEECADCNGTRFVECVRTESGYWRRATKVEYMETPATQRGSAMCHCHAGYGGIQ